MYNTKDVIERYNELAVCENDINEAFNILKECFKNNHKLLVSGNGGSASDSDHIVGELMKGFKKMRPITDDFKNKLVSLKEEEGMVLANKLQRGLPTIALGSFKALSSAYSNDVEGGADLLYAQELQVLGLKGDVYLAISTSGNAKNCYYAALCAKALGMKVIALTGKDGGLLKELADVAIIAPSNETFKIQEYHLPIYHTLCLMLEDEFF